MERRRTAKPEISLVIPVHNEASNLAALIEQLEATLAKTGTDYELIFVDDGSTDNTVDALIDLRDSRPNLRIIEFSRNFGKESALLAGLQAAVGDATIPIDADLQDPPELIERFIEEWRSGYEVVLARRSNRDEDSIFQQWTSRYFYRIFNRVAEQPIPEDVGDFRLMDRAVVDAVLRMGESNRFTKGLFSWVGFRQKTIEFERPRRNMGTSKWKPWRLWNFALDGLFSFSSLPLKLSSYLGASISVLSFLYASFLFFRTIIQGVDVPGYASIMVVILFLGGIQLISLGMIGEYIARIFNEVKQRPHFIERRRIGFEDRSKE